MIDRLLIENLPWIRSMARTFCHSACDAEDLAGDTILKILVSKARYKPDMSFRLWCLVIMRNTYLSARRRGFTVIYADDVPDLTVDPHTELIAEIHELFSILHHVSHRSRGVDSLIKYVRGYSYTEIALMEHTNANTIKARIHHARKLLLEYYDEQRVYKS